jgi:hypothetical protein
MCGSRRPRSLAIRWQKMILLALTKGQYQEIPVSIAISIITPEILHHWLTQATTMGESSWANALQK